MSNLAEYLPRFPQILLRELEWLEMESGTYRDGRTVPQLDRVLQSYLGLTQGSLWRYCLGLSRLGWVYLIFSIPLSQPPEKCPSSLLLSKKLL